MEHAAAARGGFVSLHRLRRLRRLPRLRQPGERRLLFAGAAVLTVAALAIGWQQVHTAAPQGIFVEGYRGGLTTWNDNWSVGRSLSFGMSYVAPSDLTGASPVEHAAVLSALPQVAVNTARATLTLSVCSIDTTQRVGAIGSVAGDLAASCTRVVPADGATMRVTGAAPDQLVLTVTPTRPGKVVVRGVEVAYVYKGALEAQRMGLSVRVTAPGPHS